MCKLGRGGRGGRREGEGGRVRKKERGREWEERGRGTERGREREGEGGEKEKRREKIVYECKGVMLDLGLLWFLSIVGKH